MMPTCLKAASYARSEPARVPVCEDTAREPALVVPDLMATMGFWRVTLRATRMNSGPLEIPSR